MLTAGVDIGAKTIKIVILEDGRIRAKNLTLAGYDVRESLEKAWGDLEASSGLGAGDMEKIVATGAGRQEVIMAAASVTEVTAAAKGAISLDQSVRTVIDVGAEEGRAIRIDEAGRVVDFAVNEKCAAGAGAFAEAVARALEVPLELLGPLSLRSTKAVAMNAQCAVFAESELVALIHSQTPKPDMARAIHDAISDRIASMVRRVGLDPNVMLIGGLARNVGFLTSLRKDLNHEVIVPEDPDYIGALGAALIAAEKAS
ncbi:MAG: acyl-CoA dehydratase activase [Thermodesulfobacteriota bacterium]